MTSEVLGNVYRDLVRERALNVAGVDGCDGVVVSLAVGHSRIRVCGGGNYRGIQF